MGLLLLYMAVMASFFILQGVYILKTGSVRGVFARFEDKSRTAGKPTLAMRVYCSTLYIGTGIALFVLLGFVAARYHLASSIAERLSGASLQLFFPLLSIGISSYALVGPSRVLGWLKPAYPDVQQNDPAAKALVRVIGAVGFVISMVVLYAFVS